jgi:hypothetical protein
LVFPGTVTLHPRAVFVSSCVGLAAAPIVVQATDWRSAVVALPELIAVAPAPFPVDGLVIASDPEVAGP